MQKVAKPKGAKIKVEIYIKLHYKVDDMALNQETLAWLYNRNKAKGEKCEEFKSIIETIRPIEGKNFSDRPWKSVNRCMDGKLWNHKKEGNDSFKWRVDRHLWK